MFAVVAFAVLTGCQSAVETPRSEAAVQSGDLANCAQVRLVPGGCEGNPRLSEVYVDNMHKYHAVRATVRKHSSTGEDDTDYAIAEDGELFIGCAGGETSFAVIGCEVLKREPEKTEE